MFCGHCGAQVPNDSVFCNKCGSSQAQSTGAGVAAAPAPEKKSVWLKVVITVLGALALLMMITTALSRPGKQSRDLDKLIANQVVTTNVHQQVVKDAVAIEPGHLAFYKFQLPSGSKNVKVIGHFEAHGGSGNDVEVSIVDEDGLTNLKNGHTVNAFYSSGRVTAGSIDALLPSGAHTYYLVFSNSFSAFSNKAVTANLELDYVREL